MNVVEKETTLLEGSDSEHGDVASSLKVAHGASAVATASFAPTNGNKHAKESRALAARQPHPLSGFEVRRFISDCSEKLQKFVAPLEEETRKAMRLRVRGQRHSPRTVSKVAELVLSVIRKLTHRETGIYALDPNVPMLLSALYAGSVEASIVAGLVRRAQEALAQVAQAERSEAMRGDIRGSEVGSRDYDITRELDELTMLLKWYVRRKMSLAGLEIDSIASNQSFATGGSARFSEEEDSLFGFEVVHDQQVFGAKGCFVSCGLRLVGHDGQPLWLRVSVQSDGRPVAVRSEWSSWTDPGGVEAIEVVPNHAPFCSLVPIRPNAQRLVIDDIRAFVPYGALDLPTGRADVELCVSILDNDGREILSASRPESICIPRRELVLATVPAPHSVGMWPHDVVSGDKLSDLKVAAGYKMVAGWERHSVSVQFDLSLFMHAGESVLLECRFLNEAGEIVELSSLGIPYVASDLNVAVESVSSYRYRRVLHPRGAWAYYRSLCIDIPVEFLLLTKGTHNLTCEVVIVSSDDRVLCGDMGLVTVQVPGDKAQDAQQSSSTASPSEKALAIGSIIDLESIDIDSSWHFAGEDSVRIQATFCPTNTSRQIVELAAGRVGELFSPYRVEVSVEREDGYLLLQAFSDSLGMGFKPVTRSVCVEGHSGFAEHSVVANFSKEEILGWSFGNESHRANTKLRLFARVRALSLSGEVLVSETKEFYVKPLTNGGRRVVEVGRPSPQVVDVVAYTYAQTSRVSCRALVNMPHGRILEEGVWVVGSLVMADGKRQQLMKRRIAMQQTAAWVRQHMGLSQIPVECEYTLAAGESAPPHVEFSLISAYDEVLQTVRHDVRVAGVLAAVEEGSDSVFDAAPQEHSSQSEFFGMSEPGDVQVKESKGLFSWFKR